MNTKNENAMSEISYSKMDYIHPRTIWTLTMQFFYTIIAMMPVYYYLREIIELIVDAKWLLVFLPIGIAILLFGMELRLNVYFWKAEKIFKNRDILVVVIKSSLLVITMFYFLFLFIFGYWLSDIDVYQGIKYQSDIGRLMAEAAISLLVIYGVIIMMMSIQESRFDQTFAKARKLRSRSR